MKNDMHLINEADYVSLKQSAVALVDTDVCAAISLFERIVDAATERLLALPDMDIYQAIYSTWNDIMDSTGYHTVPRHTQFATQFLLSRYWMFGDVLTEMHRDGEILIGGTSIGHSTDRFDLAVEEVGNG